MTGEKHTPGPWTVEEGMPGETWICGQADIYRSGSKRGTAVLAVIPHGDAAPAEVAPDASLIAAAPALLDAARDLLGWWDSPGLVGTRTRLDGEGKCEQTDLLAVLRAAVAKAEPRP